MAQPVKLSDQLIEDARIVSKELGRSMAGQIELWATIGRAFEPRLNGTQVRRLARPRALADCLLEPGTTEGTKKVKAYLKTRPFPHYEAAQGSDDLLVEIQKDGTRTVGKFVNREFVPVRKRKK